MKKSSLLLTLVLLAPVPLAAGDAKEGHVCAHEKAAAPAKAAHVCAAEKKADVILVGKLLCEHCNLHRKETCSPVFAAEGREGEIPICPETKDLEKIKTLGGHGTVTLEVKGVLCKAKDGTQELMITTYAKKA